MTYHCMNWLPPVGVCALLALLGKLCHKLDREASMNGAVVVVVVLRLALDVPPGGRAVKQVLAPKWRKKFGAKTF